LRIKKYGSVLMELERLEEMEREKEREEKENEDNGISKESVIFNLLKIQNKKKFSDIHPTSFIINIFALCFFK
jgi:predicted nucleic acid-binding protein